jgi:hypothetical protein
MPAKLTVKSEAEITSAQQQAQVPYAQLLFQQVLLQVLQLERQLVQLLACRNSY